MQSSWLSRVVASIVSRFLLLSLLVSLLPLSAVTLQPADAQAQPADPPIYICASLYTGAVRYVTNPNQCSSGEVLLNLNGETPVTLCVNPYTGQLRYRFGRPCTSSETPLTVPGEQATRLCVNPYTGQISYRASGACPAGTSPIIVPQANDAPIAQDDAFTIDEDTPLNGNVLADNGNGVDSDPDGDPLTVNPTPVSGPSDGVLVLNGDGNFTYTPDADFNVSDSFVYQLQDGEGGTDTATVTITVNPINDDPTANPQAVSTDEDVPLVITLTGTDVDGDSLTFAIATGPANGSLGAITQLTPTSAEVTYTPNLDYTGSDSFTFTVNDGTAASPAATVTITIAMIDDNPVAVADAATVAEDASATTIDVLANDTDVDGGPISVTSVTQPANGTVIITNAGADLTYQPDVNYCNDGSPTDDFSYTLTPGGSTATVAVTVTCVDDPPTAVDDSATVNEDSGANAINVLVNDTDADGGPISVTSVTQPANGTVVITGGGTGLTYQPNADYCNNPPGISFDTFSYTLTPGGSTATVSVTVNCVDDNPTAVADSATVAEDSSATAIDVLANDTDPDGGPISIASVTQPANGTVVITGGGTGLTYQPNANYCNDPPGTTPDTFTYTLSPGGSSTTVSVTVTCVDDAPTAVDDSATVAEDSGANALDVLGNDADIDAGPISLTVVTQPTNGTVVITGGGTGLTYAPNAEYCNDPPGTTLDTFTYTIAPGGSSATVTVTVTCVDDAPTAADDSATVVEDAPATAIDVLTNDTDPDGGALSVQSVTQPGNGTVAITGGGTSVDYTPDPNYCNAPPGTTPDTFTYTLNGGSTATVSVTVTCVDDNPVAVADAATVAEDSGANAVDVLANDTDPDGGPISIVAVTQPSNGTVAITGGGTGLSYQPNPNYCNDPPGTTPDTFTYTLGPGGSSTTVSVTVTCVDDPPVAVNDAATVTEDSGANAISVLANDTDIDGGPITIVSASDPTNGTVLITGGGTGLTYQPDLNYCNNPPGGAPDTFTYTLTPGGSTATVSVTVDCVNDPPVAGADSFDFIGNTELRVDLGAGTTPAALESTGAGTGLLGNDSDPVEGDPVAIVGVVGCADVTAPFVCVLAGVGTVTLEANGAFSFVPGAGDSDASDSFQYILSDGTDTVNGTVTLTRFERVWYVDPDAAGGGDGTSAFPFNTFSALSGAGGAGDSDVTGDTIFVHAGTLALATALPLEASQRLLGEGVGLSLPVNLNGNGLPTSLVAAGTQPQLTNGSGDTVTIGNAIPIEIRGLSLAGGTGNAIDLTSGGALSGSSSLLIESNTFRGAGAEGIDVNLGTGTTGTLNLTIQTNTWNGAGTHSGNAVDVNRVAGTLNLAFTANTGVVSNGTAVNIAGGAVANTTITAFSGNTISGDTLGAGVVMSNVTFDSTPGIPVQQVNAGALPVGASGNPVGGAGMQLTNVQGNLLFSDLDIFAATSGLTVTGTGTGLTFTATTTSTIQANNGAAVDISTAVALNLQLASLQSTASAAGVNLSSVSGTFSAASGSISKSSGGGTAFVVASSTATVTYGGSLNVTAGGGVSLTNNTGGTIGFSGPLTLSTGTNAAFTATGGGTVTATDTTSTLTTTTATALNVANTTIGSGGLNFRSISSNGAASGIVLNNTGATAGLTVSGNSGAGTGGTIQNGTIGISLTSTRNVSLAWMQMNGFSDFAIRGSSVVNFTLNNSVISGTNGNDAAADEGSVRFTELTGSATISNTNISGGLEDNFKVVNTTGTLNRITFNVVTIGANSTSNGNDGIGIEALGSAVMNVTVQNSFFTSSRGDLFQMNNNGTGSTDLDFTGNNLSNNHPGIATGGGGVTILSNGTGNFTFDITTSTFRDAVGTALLLAKATGGATFSGTISGNTIGVPAVANSGSLEGSGLLVQSTGQGTVTVAITGNDIHQYNNFGIEVRAGGGASATGGDINATITGNTVSNPGTNPAISFPSQGIHLNSGTTPGDTFQVCFDVGGAGALENSIVGSERNAGGDFRLRQRQSTTVRLPGYSGSATDTDAVVSYIQGRNTGTPSGTAAVNSPPGGGFVGGAACTQP